MFTVVVVPIVVVVSVVVGVVEVVVDGSVLVQQATLELNPRVAGHPLVKSHVNSPWHSSLASQSPSFTPHGFTVVQKCSSPIVEL